MSPRITGPGSDWRRRVQAGAKRAAAAPFINVAGLATESGWKTAQSLNQFIDKGMGSVENIRRLEAALERLGFLSKDPAAALAEDLERLAATLRDSGLPVTARLAAYTEQLQRLGAAAKKQAAAAADEYFAARRESDS